ncbi:MAG: SRPBCC domain-containing protein [Caulobacteraceae bacterium]|nr:SRPBCC domain-containing protein [Caulobacteraceae bacterium]
MRRVLAAAAVAALTISAPAQAGDDPLAPMAFLAGACWKGEFPGGGGVTDTHCFEAVNGGRGLRDRHVVEGAPDAYAGETLYRWDSAAGSIRYAYDASDGGHSEGTARAIEGGLGFEDSYLGADGSRLTMRARWIREGGDAYVATTEALEGGTWKSKFKVRFTRVETPGTVDPAFPDVRDSSYREADGWGVIQLSTVVRAPAARIWAALSTAQGWERWSVKRAWVDFRLGGMIETSYSETATQGAPANIRNRIEAYAPGRMLTIRNVQAPPGFPNAEDFAQTVTTILLTPRPDGSTEVTVTGVGFRPGASFDDLYAKFRMGNAWTLQNLKRTMEAP